MRGVAWLSCTLVVIAGCTGDDTPSCDPSATDPCFLSPIDIQVTAALGVIRSTDLDGDGIADLAIIASDDANGIQGVSTLLGDGESYVVVASYVVHSPADIATGDFDGDGHDDVVAIAYDGQGPLQSTILLGAGDGTLVPMALPQGDDYPAGRVATADIDLDGTTDMAIPIILDEQTGGPVMVRTVFGPDFTDRRSVDPTAGELTVRAVELGDLNGDGLMDLVTGAGVQLGEPGGNFGASNRFPLAGPMRSLLLVDLDGDGNLDLVAVRGGRSFDVLLGDGNGNLGPVTQHRVANETSDALASADFDGDGTLDVAVSSHLTSFRQTVTIAYGDGTGGFAAQEILDVSTDGAVGLVAIDANLDGAPDLVATNRGSGTISLFLNAR